MATPQTLSARISGITIWIAPSERDNNNAALEKRLWDAADQFHANSGLKAQEYAAPVPGDWID